MTRRTPPLPKRQRGTIERAGGQTVSKISVYIDPALAKRLRLHCVEEETNMSELVVSLIRRYLDEHKER